MPLNGLVSFLLDELNYKSLVKENVSMPLNGLPSFLPLASETPCLCWFAACDFPKIFQNLRIIHFFAHFLVFLKFSLVYHKSSPNPIEALLI